MNDLDLDGLISSLENAVGSVNLENAWDKMLVSIYNDIYFLLLVPRVKDHLMNHFLSLVSNFQKN